MQLKLKTKCEFCGKDHWDWVHNKFSYINSKLAQMSHNELLSAIIRETEKHMTEKSDWDALLCYLKYNVWVLSSSKNANNRLHRRNISIFNELHALAEKRDRMMYIERCEQLQKELYQKHLEVMKAEI